MGRRGDLRLSEQNRDAEGRSRAIFETFRSPSEQKKTASRNDFLNRRASEFAAEKSDRWHDRALTRQSFA
jgi:hypothetical protein